MSWGCLVSGCDARGDEDGQHAQIQLDAHQREAQHPGVLASIMRPNKPNPDRCCNDCLIAQEQAQQIGAFQHLDYTPCGHTNPEPSTGRIRMKRVKTSAGPTVVSS